MTSMSFSLAEEEFRFLRVATSRGVVWAHDDLSRDDNPPTRNALRARLGMQRATFAGLLRIKEGFPRMHWSS